MAKSKLNSVTDQRSFTMIYNDFLGSDVLDKHEKLIFIILKKYANAKQQAFPSLSKIAKETGINVRTVTSCIQHMEELGVLKKEIRKRKDGGQTSNLYTLYDYKEIWGIKETEIESVVEQIDLTKKIKELESLGYQVIKKEPISSADQSKEISPTESNIFNEDNNSINNEKSQDTQNEEKYSIDYIKQMISYDIIIFDKYASKSDLDIIVNIIYDTMNTKKKTIWVNKESKSSKVVCAKFAKLSKDEVVYVIEKFQEVLQTGLKIRNHTSYIRTQLYNAYEQYHLDIKNKGYFNGDF